MAHGDQQSAHDCPRDGTGEFGLIRRHFMRPVRDAVLGAGDDCALLAPVAGRQLAVSCDMLIEGRHFLSTVAPARLGHKALAVNLSDLAACGARPMACLLALSLPQADAAWLADFAAGLAALADAHGCELVGGDTVRGPLSICITAIGDVPPGAALLRSGARAGDDLWVSGQLGDARLALEAFRGTVALGTEAFDAARRAMELPTPRVALGQALRGVASSAIDLSDGLLGDLGHVLAASGVGATVCCDDVPRSAHLAALPVELQRLCTLSGGDDYELLFAAPPAHAAAVQAAGHASQTPVTRIGRIDATLSLRLLDRDGHAVAFGGGGHDHFAE